MIMDIFQSSRQNYGTRKIKKRAVPARLYSIQTENWTNHERNSGWSPRIRSLNINLIPRAAMKPSKRMY
ncbi:hypothetical protein HPL003_17615 [Paenibacillus terrae HPL-003]|uniref:Uncharacterized protein n=1 Tax=Paenibacillus terrae (strain HPL-003) TaxID=985665 RepID=G7VZH3_PAETH|nr:hypothetical protein HPL003_17615 [Paenibacillus terrae HPL-003]